MVSRSALVIVLAAGEGTRMKSAQPKVLHRIGGRSLLAHVLAAAAEAGVTRKAVVIGRDAEAVRGEVLTCDATALSFEQKERLGTAHAVLAARAVLEEGADDVIVLFGDTPLMRGETIARVRGALADGADVVVLGFETPTPTGYGRLLMEGPRLTAIREEKDASDAERQVTFCNSGVMAFSGAVVLSLLDRIGNANAKGEFYLTDAVEIANGDGLKVVALDAPFDEVLGINTRAELAEAESLFQKRKRLQAMVGGATLTAPETVFFSHDTRLGQDVLVEPHVVFAPGVTVEDGATIRAFSHLEGAHVGEKAVIGPYARLRPGAEIGVKAKVGNFCEVKKAVIAEGAKVNHLTYIGDADVGAGANIGAGTITCNYDGFSKFRTVIGAGAFIGSNSSLVAPVTIGDGAFVGSGSVITKDVPADSLSVARGKQITKEGWATHFRAKNAK